MLYIKYIEKTFSSVKGKYVLCKASMKTKGNQINMYQITGSVPGQL